MSVLDRQVLVLNRSWMAVHVASVRRALSLVFQDLAQVVSPADFSTYSFESWVSLPPGEGDEVIRSVNFEFRKPEVIRLKYWGGVSRRKVRFTRRNVFDRDDHTCQYCGKRLPPGKLSLDHVQPRSRGGRATWGNLVTACLKCNDRKADRYPHEAGMSLLREPRKPRWISFLASCAEEETTSCWKRFVEPAS